MSTQRTHWYLDQTTVHLCGKELRVYTDGRKTYAYCPVCDQKVELGDFGATDIIISTEPRKLTHLSDMDYEENLLQHGVV